MARTWRAALLAAALLALLAAHHWRGWWAPALQRQMQDQPCPADPAADPRLVPGDEGGLCVHRADNARRLAEGTQTELVLLGDSIVAGWQQVDPARFTGAWANRGVDGQASAHLLPRMRQDVIALRPCAVLIAAGLNDIIARRGVISPADYVANIESLVDLAQAHGITVILATLPPAERFPIRPRIAPQPRIDQLNAQLRALARRRGLVLADFHAALAAPGLRIDGLHPNAEGYRRLAPVVEQALAQTRKEPD